MDTKPFYDKKGRCERSRPNMKCARIGRTCRCKSSTILNSPGPVHEIHEEKAENGLEAKLDISLSINSPWNNSPDSSYESSDDESSDSMNNVTEYY